MLSQIIATLVCFAALIIIDLVPKIKKGIDKSFWISVVFLCAGFVILILTAANRNIPSPYWPLTLLQI